MHDGWTWDIAALDLADEGARTWDDLTHWDASYAQILHDPTGQVQALYDSKRTSPSPGAPWPGRPNAGVSALGRQ
jgi:hypothetical protein